MSVQEGMREMVVTNQDKPCLKEINPEDYPGVYFGEPYKYDPSCGECCDCPNKCNIERKLKRREIK